jgi:phosphoglycolate phosphatase-like HAD superfamily hydrolase
LNIKVIVFDFDGTLIDSNQLKYDAFFELFPPDDPHKKIVIEVLHKYVEESRYVILREILNRIDSKRANEYDLDYKVQELADKYNKIVVGGVKCCREIPGAGKALEYLSKKYKLYLSSTTPEEDLKVIVKQRGWDSYFQDISGYPKRKSGTLVGIIDREGISTDEALVVGDGESDRVSSEIAGSGFFHIQNEDSINELLSKF